MQALQRVILSLLKETYAFKMQRSGSWGTAQGPSQCGNLDRTFDGCFPSKVNQPQRVSKLLAIMEQRVPSGQPQMPLPKASHMTLSFLPNLVP